MWLEDTSSRERRTLLAGFLGYGLDGAIAVGVGASFGWLAVAAVLGRRYEKLRGQASGAPDPETVAI